MFGENWIQLEKLNILRYVSDKGFFYIDAEFKMLKGDRSG
jgi:hypothetical protein